MALFASPLSRVSRMSSDGCGGLGCEVAPVTGRGDKYESDTRMVQAGSLHIRGQGRGNQPRRIVIGTAFRWGHVNRGVAKITAAAVGSLDYSAILTSGVTSTEAYTGDEAIYAGEALLQAKQLAVMDKHLGVCIPDDALWSLGGSRPSGLGLLLA